MTQLRQVRVVQDVAGTTIAQDVAAIARIEAVPRLLRVLCETTGMGFTAVARVTDTTWTACAVHDEVAFGLQPGGELPLESTLCHEVRHADEPIFIDQASLDPLYRSHHTPRIYGIESYASVPIKLPSGEYFGNLCAIDPKPHKVKTPAVISMFELFAQLIALQLASDRERALAETRLLDVQAAGELREQFIAVLGHDLRNPLAAISAGATMLARKPGDATLVAGTAERLQRSVRRMSALIDDVLDFARGRLGGGIDVRAECSTELGAALAAVASELRDAHPGREIDARIDLPGAFRGDVGRIQQLASNLLGNALTHGAETHPVRLNAAVDGGMLVLDVWNDGEPIPADRLGAVFAPFWRRSASREGLGLGLYICSQIVKSHGGQLTATSTAAEGTHFVARIPLGV